MSNYLERLYYADRRNFMVNLIKAFQLGASIMAGMYLVTCYWMPHHAFWLALSSGLTAFFYLFILHLRIFRSQVRIYRSRLK